MTTKKKEDEQRLLVFEVCCYKCVLASGSQIARSQKRCTESTKYVIINLKHCLTDAANKHH